MDDIIVKIGQVESLDDEKGGLRIKVRLEQDKELSVADLPYAFPLLPKTFQTIPKVGEAVFVITSKLNNKNSIRYYIGPIISQAQYMYNDQYLYGFGQATSLLQGAYVSPEESIDRYYVTKGAFPKSNDVALIGRKGEDVVLKDDEIDIRCGIRVQGDENDENLPGYVFMNTLNPAYIQLKFKNGIGYSNKQEANSVVNVVADKINLISHKDVHSFNLTDQEELIKTSEMDNIMSKLHQLPYGDVLVETLKDIVYAFINHVHPYPGLPPCTDIAMEKVKGIDYDTLLSPNVRIS